MKDCPSCSARLAAGEGHVPARCPECEPTPTEAVAALREALLEAVSPFLRWVLLRMEDVLLIAAKAEQRIWRRK